MSNEQFQKELSSYVSFALKVKPGVDFAGHYSDKGSFAKKPLKQELSSSDNLSAQELSSIDELMAKYQMLKKFLPPKSALSKLKVIPGYIEPKDKPALGVKYRNVAVNANQFEIAKTVASMVEGIYSTYLKGDQRQAKTSYLDFQNYLSTKRSELIGEFRTVRELEDTMGMYGVGLNGGIDTRDKMYWLPVFIVIEIWIG
jgi:hypothetical protein